MTDDHKLPTLSGRSERMVILAAPESEGPSPIDVTRQRLLVHQDQLHNELESIGKTVVALDEQLDEDSRENEARVRQIEAEHTRRVREEEDRYTAEVQQQQDIWRATRTEMEERRAREMDRRMRSQQAAEVVEIAITTLNARALESPDALREQSSPPPELRLASTRKRREAEA